ncbi:class I SAM-dependent methyltransferase [Clostridium sp. UBA1652]|uniref:class I SAM-dependent methyltransferase n=1 Tax=Clostridium sp. UBA1652 TaxID=1946348 RepID=UPI0025811A16|nr:methyltransferase domain-containing protein [Clostridium sp. UBA1652]
MHYNIRDLTIKSEYAAKSAKQTNSEILNIIKNLPSHFTVLDYGCGKLRYTIPLAKVVKSVHSIDSLEQLLRNQRINDISTNIVSYVEQYLNNVHIYDVKDPKWKMNKYDFILCTNVLSAVPQYKERIEIVKNIGKVLKENGRAFISTQYYNSYFDTYNTNKSSIRFYDGWIIKSKNYSSFYGIIGIKKLEYYARVAGVKIIDSYTKNGSAYLLIAKK